MFDWLFDNWIAVYAVLTTLGVVFLVVWWRTRNRKLLFAVTAALALAGIFALLDAVVETTCEQITRKLQEMAEAVKAKNADRIFSHIARDFSVAGRDKAAFRSYVDLVLQRNLVDELLIWDEQFLEGGDDRTRPVHFLAKPLGSVTGRDLFYAVKATFVLEADGEWRLRGFEVSDPVTKQQIQVLQLP